MARTTARTTQYTLALLVAAATIACGSPTPARIAAWKSAPDGADRLREAVKDAKAPPDLRAQAAAALFERDGADPVAAVVAGLPIDERAPLIPPLVPRIATSLRSPDAARASEAREALFSLRQEATTEDARAAIDGALFPALREDLQTGRTTGGRHTLAEMLIALGASSVPTVQSALDDARAPFAPAYQVLDKVGDKAAKAKGGAALARRARALTGPVPPELWTALGTLAGPDAIAFLEERVDRGAGDEPKQAATALALIKWEPTLLPFALRKAGDTAAPEAVRDKMIDVIKNVGGEDARKGIVKLIAEARDPAYRYRLFGAALKVGGGAVLAPALEALPQDGSYTIDDIRKNMVDPIYSLGFENREGLFKALESKSPVARMAAVLTLEKSGFGSDAQFVIKLEKDRGVVKGFPRGDTVGAEATRVAALLKKNG